jgi:UDP-hydrolysing UDP-N-acetyl-D-glucosamine 2-epimerase
MRKVCVVVHSRANYGRIKSVLRAIQNHPGLELQLIVGSSALLYRFGQVIDQIDKDGFQVAAVVHSVIEGEIPITMAKSTGLAIIELATHFGNLDPDIVLTLADRHETLSTAVAASYMNIALAHTQGGEVTGSIDESVRHAITKLAHIHFPATERARDYVIRMGEPAETVHLTGCPSIDLVAETNLTLPQDIFERYKGVGDELSPYKEYIIVLQHPVTTEYGRGFAQINTTLEAVHRKAKAGIQIVWLWPNVDAGSDDVARGIRMFREQNDTTNMHFYKNFAAEDYARLLANARCIVGNSSSGLREGAFLGTPCVNVGTRQQGREREANVLDVPNEPAAIGAAIDHQLAHGRYPQSTLVGNGTAGRQIADVLATCRLSVQKRISYVDEENA